MSPATIGAALLTGSLPFPNGDNALSSPVLVAGFVLDLEQHSKVARSLSAAVQFRPTRIRKFVPHRAPVAFGPIAKQPPLPAPGKITFCPGAKNGGSTENRAIGLWLGGNTGAGAPLDRISGRLASVVATVWPYVTLSKVTPETSPVSVE